MKILYFTATGNNLSVAKRFEAELLSIPQMIKNNNYLIEDDKVGIIYPIYSLSVPLIVKQYLEKCINSILAQTLYRFELVLVDDGSPDNCGKMCDVYAVKDNRIRVVHKKNGGLSSARNAGIDVCVGSYVIFIDSDDFWDDENALKKIYSNLLESNAELLVFPAKRYYEKNDTYTYILNTKADRKCVLDNNPNNAIRYMLENNI